MAKTVEVDLQVNSNIQGSIAELKALKRQLKDTAAGSTEFKALYNQIDDLEDKIKSSKNASSDWVDSLEQAGGPLGALGASINKAKVATQSFGGALKATGIGLIVSLVAGLAAAFNDNEKAQKKLQPLLTSLQKIFQGVYSVVEPLFFTLVDLATKALPYVSDAFKVVYSSVTAVFQSLGKLGSAVKKLIGGDFSGAWDDAKSSVTSFSKNFNDAKNRYEKGSNELTKTEKENADKRAEALEKENEKKKAAEEKRLEALKEHNKKLKEEREKAAQEERDFFIGIDNVNREQRVAAALDKELSDAKVLSDATAVTDALMFEDDKRIESEQKTADAKKAIQMATFETAANGLAVLSKLFEKNKALQKAALLAESAIGIAKIIISTQAANAAARLKYSLIPGGAALAAAEITLNKINAGIGIAANLVGTAKGLQALGGGSASGASVGGGGAGGEVISAAPTFNVVGTSGQNQIAQSLGQQAPVKAYVVSNDVTTAQSLDRNIVKTATL